MSKEKTKPNPSDSSEPFFDFKEAQVQNFASGYIAEYYLQPPTNDERVALPPFVKFLKSARLPKVNGVVSHLDAACGPTLHHVLPVTPYVDQIIMADYLDENLDAVSAWCKKKPSAIDWSQYTSLILELEGQIGPTKEAVSLRENETRKKITELIHCNFMETNTLRQQRRFSSVGCFYGTEEVGVTIEGWKAIIPRIIEIVTPGGYLFLAILGKTPFYHIKDGSDSSKSLPCAYLTINDVLQYFCTLTSIDQTTLKVDEADVQNQSEQGVNQVITVIARRRI